MAASVIPSDATEPMLRNPAESATMNAPKPATVVNVAARPPFLTGYGMKQVYFKDPDGYDICLQQPV